MDPEITYLLEPISLPDIQYAAVHEPEIADGYGWYVDIEEEKGPYLFDIFTTLIGYFVNPNVAT
jgi:hypothetical protein